VISVLFWPSDDERDILIAELWEAGTTGITETPNSLRAFFKDHITAESMAEKFAHCQPEIVEEPDQDWIQQTYNAWQPFTVGDRFYLVPEWLDDPAPPGRIRLTIHPGMACGTGAHPATQLCLEAMEKFVGKNDRVLDVGTGTGILAGAAGLLGAHGMAGCDVDADATVIARGNWPEIPFFTGSLECVRSGSVSLIVANLSAAILEHIAPELRRVGATLIVSGFQLEEAARVLESIGLPEKLRLEKDGWACLVLRA
jgi:ribosomal protein L11 methyltransferase